MGETVDITKEPQYLSMKKKHFLIFSDGKFGDFNFNPELPNLKTQANSLQTWLPMFENCINFQPSMFNFESLEVRRPQIQYLKAFRWVSFWILIGVNCGKTPELRTFGRNSLKKNWKKSYGTQRRDDFPPWIGWFLGLTNRRPAKTPSSAPTRLVLDVGLAPKVIWMSVASECLKGRTIETRVICREKSWYMINLHQISCSKTNW